MFPREQITHLLLSFLEETWRGIQECLRSSGSMLPTLAAVEQEAISAAGPANAWLLLWGT